MASDDHPPPLRVRVTDERGRPLRRPGLSGWLAVVAPAHARGVIAIALVSDATMRRLNRQFAGASHATDVLSFPAVERRTSVQSKVRVSGRIPAVAGQGFSPAHHLGDVVIAVGIAARQAKAMDHSLATELRVLALHGLLHLLGYDHSTDRGEMARVERRLRRKGGLRDGLIDRAASRSVGRASRPSLAARGAGGTS